ncbi:MAG: DUF1080 domain-containing protein [Verrucomicrobia bacterium]|nr:DUF1080 domain-containing protein [Verrucomicrobiota bacterium]
MNSSLLRALIFLAALAALAPTAPAADAKAKAAKPPSLGYTDTPMLPGDKWHVHDPARPQPAIITPGTASTPDKPGKAPSDAIVLFDGKDVSKWRDAKQGDAKWIVKDGEMISVKGAGYVYSKQEFSDYQLHLEFAAPTPPEGDSQGRGNSGVFMLGKFELQVLDSYDNKTYPDGQCAAMYGQFPPLVNACRKPGEWQSYDIIFTAAKFEGGEVKSPAHITVLHNGVVVHNHNAYLGGTGHKISPSYKNIPVKGPIGLQDHGNPVRYRNIWVRELKGYDQP